MSYYKLLAKGPYEFKDFEITLVNSGRKTSPKIEKKIDLFWDDFYKQAVDEGKLIYNGVSYRLDWIEVTDSKVLLEVSKIDFKTRMSLVKLRDTLSQDFDYTANGLVIGGFIKTSDNKFVFGIRSGKTLANNEFDFIGGIIEDSSPLGTGTDLEIHLNKEIEEEVGVDPEMISKSKILGVVFTHSTNIIFLTLTNLKIDSKKLMQLQKKHHDIEMEGVKLVSKDDLEDFLTSIGGHRVNAFKEFKDLI